MLIRSKPFLKQALTSQLLMLYGLLLVCLTITSAALLYQETLTLGEKQVALIGRQLSQQTASASINMLVNGDRLSLNVLLKQLLDSPYIVGAAIYGVDKQRIALAGKDLNIGEVLSYREPIVYQDVIIGYFILYMNRPFLKGQAMGAVYPFLIISLLFLVIGLLVVYFYGEHLVEQLQKIERQLCLLFPNVVNVQKKNELSNILMLTEGQLIRRAALSNSKKEKAPYCSRAAIGFCVKEIERLEMQCSVDEIKRFFYQQKQVVDSISSIYKGKPDYWSGGKGCIYFSDDEGGVEHRVLSCALLIVMFFGKEELEVIKQCKLGFGLALESGLKLQEDAGSTLDSASLGQQALMLASIAEVSELCLFTQQLGSFPNGLITAATKEMEPYISYLTDINSRELYTEIESTIASLQKIWG